MSGSCSFRTSLEEGALWARDLKFLDLQKASSKSDALETSHVHWFYKIHHLAKQTKADNQVAMPSLSLRRKAFFPMQWQLWDLKASDQSPALVWGIKTCRLKSMAVVWNRLTKRGLAWLVSSSYNWKKLCGRHVWLRVRYFSTHGHIWQSFEWRTFIRASLGPILSWFRLGWITLFLRKCGVQLIILNHCHQPAIGSSSLEGSRKTRGLQALTAKWSPCFIGSRMKFSSGITFAKDLEVHTRSDVFFTLFDLLSKIWPNSLHPGAPNVVCISQPAGRTRSWHWTFSSLQFSNITFYKLKWFSYWFSSLFIPHHSVWCCTWLFFAASSDAITAARSSSSLSRGIKTKHLPYLISNLSGSPKRSKLLTQRCLPLPFSCHGSGFQPAEADLKWQPVRNTTKI